MPKKSTPKASRKTPKKSPTKKAASKPSATLLKVVHFCEHASMSTDGKLNLIGIFESIFSTECPTVHPQMYILAKIEFSKGLHNIRFELTQDGQILKKMEFTKETARDKEEQNHFWGISFLALNSWNPLILSVFDNENWIGHAELPIYRLPNTNLPHANPTC